jgi:hypothetical protein
LSWAAIVDLGAGLIFMPLFSGGLTELMTQTYNNGYYIASFLCLARVAIALTMKSGRPTPGVVVRVEI